MRKAKICAVGNEGRFNYIILDKNKDFFDWLALLLFESFGVYDVQKYEAADKKGNWVTRKKQIRNFTDKHESYTSKKARVDVFYGKKKVFIAFNTSLSGRAKFMEVLNKISVWKKPEKSKHVKGIWNR